MAEEPKPRLQAGNPEFLKGVAADDCGAGTWANPPAAGTNVGSYQIGDAQATFYTPATDASTPAVLITNIPNGTLVAACTAVEYSVAPDATHGITWAAPDAKISTTDTTLAQTDLVVTVTPDYGTAAIPPTNWGTYTVKITLTDPCLTPSTGGTGLVKPTLADVIYYIGAGSTALSWWQAGNTKWALDLTPNSVTDCPKWTYTTAWTGDTEVSSACSVDLVAATITCDDSNAANAAKTADLAVTVAYPNAVDAQYGNAALNTATKKVTFASDNCLPLEGATVAPDLTTTVVTSGGAKTIAVPAFTFAPVPPCDQTQITRTAIIDTNANAATDLLIKAAIDVSTFTASGNIVVTNTNAALNGVTAYVRCHVVSPSPAQATLTDTAFTSVQTIVFDDGCEAPDAVTSTGTVVIAADYLLGSGAVLLQDPALATQSWAAFTTATFPGAASPTCAWTYQVTPSTAITAAGGSTAYDLTARTITLNETDASLVGTQVFTVKPYTPNGVATAPGTGITVTVTIAANPACEQPPMTVSLPTAIADQTYQVGQGSDLDIIFAEWPYTTTAGSTCTLLYSLSIPASLQTTALAGTVTTTNADRKFAVTSVIGSAGTYKLSAVATSPLGVAITPALQLDINLTIKDRCDPPASVTAPTIPAKEAKMDNQEYTVSWDAWTTQSPSDCTLSYTVSGYDAITSVVTLDLANRSIKVKGTNNLLAGVYTLTVTALSHNGGALNTASTATMQLTIFENAATTARVIAQSVIDKNYVYPSVVRIARNAVNLRPSSISSITDFTGFNQGAINRGRTTLPKTDTARGNVSKPATGGVDSFDNSPQVDFGARTEQPSTVEVGDPFREAEKRKQRFQERERKRLEDDNRRPRAGANSFDFALDNLSGYYGNLELTQ